MLSIFLSSRYCMVQPLPDPLSPRATITLQHLTRGSSPVKWRVRRYPFPANSSQPHAKLRLLPANLCMRMLVQQQRWLHVLV